MPAQARRLARRAISWSLLANTVPIYSLYVLLFVDAGLSVAQVSALFMLWSTVGILAEVPTGALADRFSRRGALVTAGLLQAAGYTVWTTLAGFPGFAAGFVLWGIAGALTSGSFEALVYDGLAAAGAERHYASVVGRAEAAGLLGQLPAAGAASLLYALGGYRLVGWVSVGVCLAAAAVASALPEIRGVDGGSAESGYLQTLRAGLGDAAATPAIRTAVLAFAALFGLDALEEYLPLLADGWGVPVALVPLAVLAIPLAGALGSALGGPGARLPGTALGAALALAALMLGAAGVLGRPVGLVGVAVFYGLYRLVLVVADARLQARITGASRATVTSVAGFGAELAAIVVFVVWPLGGLPLAAALALAVALALPRWLRRTD